MKTIYYNGVEYPDIDNYEDILDCLNNNQECLHWEYGDSLHPYIKDMEYCHISKCNKNDVNIGDCVFCCIGEGHFMVHRVTDKHIEKDGTIWFQIGDTWNNIYGWTTKVYGIAKSTGIKHE